MPEGDDSSPIGIPSGSRCRLTIDDETLVLTFDETLSVVEERRR